MATKAKSKQVKFSPKQVATFKGIGENIVAAEVNAGDSVYSAAMKAWGLPAAALVMVSAGMDAAWEKAFGQIKADAKKNIGRTGKTYDQTMQPYYNRRSESKAILKAFTHVQAALEGADKLPDGTSVTLTQSKAKDFAKFVGKLEEASGQRRDMLVIAARNLFNKRAKHVSDSERKEREEKREANAWKQKRAERVEQMRKLVQFAPLAVLEQMQQYISKQISRLQSAAEAKVKEGSKTATVHKLRRAA